MASNVFRIIGTAVLAAVVVWALVLGWWQSNDHRPDSGELVLYLLALPLALVGGYWLIRLSIDQLKGKPEGQTTAPQTAADSDPLAMAQAKTAAAERGYSLRAVDAFVVAAGGSSAEEILAAIDAGKRPEPVPELIDSAGFPVVAAVAGELDTGAVAEAFAENHPGLRKLLAREEALRALGLLDLVLQQACEAIRARLAEPPAGKLRLQLLCLLPAAWESGDFPALRSWLQAFDWPPGEIVELDVQLVPVASDVDALRQVDQAILQANRETAGEHLILVAGAMSAVTQDRITDQEAMAGLFSSQHQDRSIPGEGAVAILLAPDATCAKLHWDDGLSVSRVGHALRDKSLHAGGRISGTLISELLTDLLGVSGVAAEDIKAAVVDTDHRATHQTEMLEGLGVAFTHLDPLKDCPATGTVNGRLTPLGGLFALVCACQRAQADQAPVLCLSNQHDRERAALLVRPVTSPSSSESRNT